MVKEKLDVKVGDLVIVRSRWHESIQKVERITSKGAIRVNGTLYDEYGIQKGSDVWSRSELIKGTVENLKEFKEKKYTAKVLHDMHECKAITYKQAVEIEKILNTEN